MSSIENIDVCPFVTKIFFSLLSSFFPSSFGLFCSHYLSYIVEAYDAHTHTHTLIPRQWRCGWCVAKNIYFTFGTLNGVSFWMMPLFSQIFWQKWNLLSLERYDIYYSKYSLVSSNILNEIYFVFFGMLEMLVHVVMRARAYSLFFWGGMWSARTWKFSMANIQQFQFLYPPYSRFRFTHAFCGA